MRRWRYIAAEEHLYLEPQPHICSPGDVILATSNPDPTRFVEHTGT